ERDLCYLNPFMDSLVKYVRNLGYRTAIISDTYLSSADLRAILSHNGLDPALFDLVIASNEAGCTKRQGGALFGRALAQLGISGAELLHVGDNYASDIEASSKFGIIGIFYYQTTAEQNEIFQSEHVLSPTSVPVAASLDSLRRLSARRIASNDAFSDGAFTFGPVLARFADWSLDLFAGRGVRKVLALMREGELLGELLRRAAAAGEVDIEVVSCYVSRKSTGLASLFEGVTAGRLYDLLMGRPGLTIGDAMSILGIAGEAERQLPPSTLCRKMESREVFDSIVRLILEGRALRALIEKRAAESQSLAFEYLSAMAGNEECIGILDLGWSGSIQRNISRIFRNGGRRVKTIGSYVCTTQKAGFMPLEGDETHAFVTNLWTRGNLIVEVPILATVGSTEGYARNARGQVAPVLGSSHVDKAELDLKKSLREGILSFQADWLALKSFKGTRVLTQTVLAEIDAHNPSILVRLIDYPTRMEAVRLGSLHHEENYGAGSSSILCDKESEEVFQSQGVAGLFQQMNCFWPQGIIARDAPRLMSGLSQRWTAPLAFGRFGGRTLLDGKPCSLSDEEHRFLLEILRDHPYDQIVFLGSSLEGDSDFLKSLAANACATFRSSDRTSSDLDQGGADKFPSIIEARIGGLDSGIVQVDGHVKISVDTDDIEGLGRRVRGRVPRGSRCLMLISESMRGIDVTPVLHTLAPSFGPGSIIAANHGRVEIPSLANGFNIKTAIQQWHIQTGKQAGFEFLDWSHYGKLLPLYWTFLTRQANT
ncbi:MAG: HAD family hydrolase, partial [Syntrophobacteraceae bacterium]